MIDLYAVLRKDGTIKTSDRGRKLCIYRSFNAAKRGALSDGDSIVTLEIDHNREPMFIRSRRVNGES